MTLTQRIKLIAREKNETFASIERALMLGQGTIRKWDNNQPSIEKLKKVADLLEVPIDWLVCDESNFHNSVFSNDLTNDEIELLSKYKMLESDCKIRVLERIQTFLDVKTIEKKPPQHEVSASATNTKTRVPERGANHFDALQPALLKREMRVFNQSASAGLGDYLHGEADYELISVNVEDIPQNADFGIRISGDSMEPDIPDGCIVWVEEMLKIPNGKIGIFILNDTDAFCKELKINYDRREMHLVSTNKKTNQLK